MMPVYALLDCEQDVIRLGGDIIRSERFAKARKVPHHRGKHNVAGHCMETAGYALLIARWLNRHGIAANERDAVRASLLHDIGMTEEEVHSSPSRVKARSHPLEGSRIAVEEYGANEVQADAILHHMWPIATSRPHGAVGWVVTAADKRCSMHEFKRDMRSAFDKRRQISRSWL